MLIASGIAQAQADLQLSAGWSIPLGKFKEKNLEDGGYARPGLAITFDGGYKFRNNLGVMVLISSQKFPFDDNTAEEDYSDLLPDYIVSLRIDPFSYQSVLGMIGPFYQLDLGERFNLRLKGGIGLFHSRIGDQGLIAKVREGSTGDVKTVIRKATSTDSNKFSYFVGAGIYYELTKWFFFKADGLFTSSDPEYTLTNLENVTTTVDQKTSFININLGVSFIF